MSNSYSTNPYKIKRPSPTYRAIIKLYVDYDGVYVEKNKYGPTGKVDTRDIIDIMCHILGKHVFDGKMKLFQEGMIEQSLKPAICKVLEKHKVLEGEENDKI